MDRIHKGTILSAILIPAAVIMSSGCHTEQVSAHQPRAVRVYEVGPVSFQSELRYAATVEPSAQVSLAFRVPGFVEEIQMARGVDGRLRPLEAGDMVKAGSVLARIRTSEYRARTQEAQSQAADAEASKRAVEAQAAEAKASLVQADLDWGRAERLFAGEAMTRAEHDAARARHDAAAARYQAAQAQVSAIDARIGAARAAVEGSRITLNDTALVAPFTGVVVSRRVERGGLVDSATAAFTIVDLSRVKLVFPVADSSLPKLPVGAPVRVVVDALPGRQFTGHVQSVAPAADAATRSFRIEAIVANPEQALRGGMVASVSTNEKVEAPQLAVPLSALVRLDNRGNEFGVFVVDGGVARKRRLAIGVPSGTSVPVLAGLRAKAQVVRDSVAGLADGESVQIVP